MTRQRRPSDDRLRRSLQTRALARPELRLASDGVTRTAPASPHSAPIKAADPETRRLIDEAIAARAAKPEEA